MTRDFDHQGLPPDLDARLTKARTEAERAFREARKARPLSDIRPLLIDVWIRPEVIAYARCVCEAARRGLVRVSEVERLVDDELGKVVRRRLSAHGFLYLRDEREAEARVKASSEWGAYLTERLRVAELLTADSASKAVEGRAETPATPAAGAVEESKTEHPITPLLASDPATAPTVDLPSVPSIPKIGSQRPPETIDTARSTEHTSLSTWAELELRFLSDQSLQFVVKGTPRAKQNYAELGFEDGRTGTPVQAWQTLLELASHDGDLTVDRSPSGYPKQQKRIQEIRVKLQKLFPCKGNPLPVIENHYRTQFRVTRAPSFDR